MYIMNTTKLLKAFKKHKWYIMALCGAIALFAVMNLKGREGFESGEDTFHRDVRVGKKLVWFYAPWCGHCKTMHKDWDEATLLVNRNKKTPMIKINVGEKDNAKHQQISNEFNIQGFPTILGLSNGKKESEYKGDRTSDAFVKHVQTM
jgi:thioredoxin-like negative regulator of GroEL